MATPKIHQAARTSKFVAVKGVMALQDLGSALRTLKNTIRTIGRWTLTFENFPAELPQKTRNIHVNFSAIICLFFTFSRPKQGLFKTKNLRVAPASAELPQNAAECRRSAATHSPQKHAKLTKFCLIVSQRNLLFSKLCPKFLNYCRSKTSGAKSGQGGFFGPMAIKRGCLRNSQRKSVK